MARFSKEAIIHHLRYRAQILKEKHKFDLSNGTAQLRGRTQDDAVAYGEMRAFLDLIASIEGGYLS